MNTNPQPVTVDADDLDECPHQSRRLLVLVAVLGAALVVVPAVAALLNPDDRIAAASHWLWLVAAGIAVASAVAMFLPPLARWFDLPNLFAPDEREQRVIDKGGRITCNVLILALVLGGGILHNDALYYFGIAGMVIGYTLIAIGSRLR